MTFDQLHTFEFGGQGCQMQATTVLPSEED